MLLNLKPHRTSVLLVYCTSLPLKIELLHPILGPVETAQMHRQVGFLILYYKPDFIVLFNWCSQLVLIAQIHMTSGMLVKNKCL